MPTRNPTPDEQLKPLLESAHTLLQNSPDFTRIPDLQSPLNWFQESRYHDEYEFAADALIEFTLTCQHLNIPIPEPLYAIILQVAELNGDSHCFTNPRPPHSPPSNASGDFERLAENYRRDVDVLRSSPAQVCRAMLVDGATKLARIAVLRRLFNLSHEEARRIASETN